MGAEVDFDLEVALESGVAGRGQIDLLERDAEGRGRVVDYKTGRSAPAVKDAQESPQLGLYQLAVMSGAVAGAEGAEAMNARRARHCCRCRAASPASSRRSRSTPMGAPGCTICSKGSSRRLPLRTFRRGAMPVAITARFGAAARLSRRGRRWRDGTLDDPLGGRGMDARRHDRAAGGGTPRLEPHVPAAIGGRRSLEPGLIVAGAGSGKTEVMAARVVHLVATGQVRPDEVLGLTFTTKATASLAARVRSGLDRLRDRLRDQFGAAAAGSPGWDGEPVVLTYNGYGARLVADHGLRIGIEPAARLAPEGLRWQLALSVVRHWSEPLDVDWTPVTVAERVRQLADEMSSHLADPADVIAAVAATEAMLDSAPKIGAEGERARDGRPHPAQLLALVEAFEKAKRDGLLLDYGDQVALAARLAGQTVVAVAERTAHRVVLLDEYQDTGRRPADAAAAAVRPGHPVTAVGDPAQSIYGFRGASVGNILNFPGTFLVLSVRRRSPPGSIR